MRKLLARNGLWPNKNAEEDSDLSFIKQIILMQTADKDSMSPAEVEVDTTAAAAAVDSNTTTTSSSNNNNTTENSVENNNGTAGGGGGTNVNDSNENGNDNHGNNGDVSSSGRSKRVYVGNLAWSVSWQDLKDLFKTTGHEVTRADVMTTYDGRSKGCGIVEFASTEGSKQAILTLNDTELHGRQIFVREDVSSIVFVCLFKSYLPTKH